MSNKGNITTTEHDPHPSSEGGYSEMAADGPKPKHDIYPNDAIHNGKQRQNQGIEQKEKSVK